MAIRSKWRQMVTLAKELRARLGGRWEGDEEECQGLVVVGGVKLKVVLERDGGVHGCEVFEGGAVVGRAREEGALRAVGAALRRWKASEG